MLILPSCSNVKHLADNEDLYVQTIIDIESNGDIEDKADLENKLELLSLPKPNTKTGNLFRSRLWVYNQAQKREGKAFYDWLAKRVAEKPALYDPKLEELTAEKMEKHLFNEGYFFSEVESSSDNKRFLGIPRKKRKLSAYTIKLSEPYLINEVSLPSDEGRFYNVLRSKGENTLLKKGERFTVAKLKKERTRITNLLREEGYYTFNKELIRFDIDSTSLDNRVNLIMNILPAADSISHTLSRVNNVYIFPNQSPYRSKTAVADTSKYGDYYFIHYEEDFDPALLSKSIFFKKGEPYRQANYNSTVNHFISYGIYKYVNVKLAPEVTEDYEKLDVYVYLTLKDRLEFSAELEANSKTDILASAEENSNSFNLGIAGSLNHSNINTFSGGEQLTGSVSAGVEMQAGYRSIGEPLINTLDINTQVGIVFPKFIVPFSLETVSRYFIPKTTISAGFGYQNRTQFYTLGNFNFQFGYNWREDAQRHHRLNPVNINLLQLVNVTDSFQLYLESDPATARSLEEQLIIGNNYTYTYSNQNLSDLKNYFFFRGNLEFSGNAMSLGNSILGSSDNDLDGSNEIFGVNYAQFARMESEFRYYRILRPGHQIATRAFAGVGVPYGNSEVLPYVKQFYAGGSNGIRAFRIRAIGPGGFKADDSDDNLFFDQTGEVRLEANAEYRFNIISIFKGAAFVDAGNVWTLKETASKPKGGISEDFFEEIAIGTGLGLRVDFSYFIIRLDSAFPIKSPLATNGWLERDIDIFDAGWRKSNLVYNLAIGYPF